MITYFESVMADLVQYEWVGILIARIAVGALFLLSGAGKLFNSSKRKQMEQTVAEAGIPLPKLNALFVSSVEFICGSLLILGLLTPLACVLLSGVMLMALVTVQIPGIEAKSSTGWLGAFLYLPEVLYLVILIWLLLAGPVWFSLDYVLLRIA